MKLKILFLRKIKHSVSSIPIGNNPNEIMFNKRKDFAFFVQIRSLDIVNHSYCFGISFSIVFFGPSTDRMPVANHFLLCVIS